MEETREKNRKKLELQKLKQEKINEKKVMKSNDEMMKRRFKEHEQQRKNQAEEERKKKKLEEMEELERLKSKEEASKKEQQQEEYRRKINEQRLKDEEFRNHIEQIFQSQQNKLIERQSIMNEKDAFRKKQIEAKKAELIETSKSKSQINKMKIEKTIRKMEQNLENQRIVRIK